MTCWKICKLLPGYLDGALGAPERGRVREHLEFCEDCRRELERYQKLSRLMARVERAAPPPELHARIRSAVSQARTERPWPVRAWRHAALMLEDLLEPLAVPATTGVVAALGVFAVVLHTLFVGVPLGAVPNDLPINLVQPARLESLAPFPMAVETSNGRPGPSDQLLVEATVNARGEVVSYHILSGPDGLTVRRQLDQVLLFSRFRPQMNFGRPQSGGRVMLSFSEVRVRG